MGIFDFFKKGNGGTKIDNPKPNVTVSSKIEVADVIPIEKRMAGKPPTCDGLYPHEILLISYAPVYIANGENTFPGFWWYKYGIKNVQTLLDSLQRRGYIKVGSVRDAVVKEKLPSIKEELKKRNLKVSGKKDELIDRLFECVSEDELGNIFTKRPYCLTPLGEEMVKKYEWIPFIHAHIIEDLDIWNLTDLVQQPPYMKYRDKIWGYLNKAGITHINDRNFGLYRCTRFTMSEFVADEGKNDIAFPLLCEVIAYDLSGLSNSFRMELLDIYVKGFFPYENSIYTMASGITARVKEYAKIFGWSEEELHRQLIIEISKIELPFRLFTNEECADIVIAEIHEDKDILTSIYQKAENRFRKQYKIK